MRLLLVDRKQEAPDTTSFFFKPDEPVTWTAGQFMVYTLPHDFADDRGTERYFTISSAPFEGEIRLTTRFVADGGSTFKRHLERLPIGGAIEASGPDGDFVVADPTEDMVWIAGGIGITPFRSMLMDLDHRNLPAPSALLYANRDDHFIFRSEFETLSIRHPEFRIHYFVSPSRIGALEIKKAVPDIKKPTFYVSGPESMVEDFDRLLTEMGVPEHHLKKDYFPGYKPF